MSPTPEPRPALPSATVLLVRDEPAFEVLMVKRHHQIEFASGALVFPGGKVEAGDGDPAWADHAFGWGDVPDGERALRVCALREAFEESGILVARHAGEADWEIGSRTAAMREQVAAGRTSFLDLVAEAGLKLDLAAMQVFAHWITPAGMPKRFDTRFYLLTAPADQIAACDGCETVDAEWIGPGEALARSERGECTIVFPTRLNLRLLAESASVGEAVTATGSRTVVTIEPTLSRDARGLAVSIPPDVGYGPVPPQRF